MAEQEKVFTPGGRSAEKTAQPATAAREGEPFKSKQPMSGCTKLLLGCGCGCVSLLVIAVVAGVAIFWWAIAEKPLDPPEIFIDSDAVSIAHLRIDKDNPISRPLIQDLDAEFSKRKSEKVKEWEDVSTLADLIARALPVQVTAISRRGLVGAAEKEDMLVVVGYARLSNLVNWFWEEISEESEDSSTGIKHEGVHIILVRKLEEVTVDVVQSDDSFMTCLGSNLIVSTDVERVKRAVSRQRGKKADFGGNEVVKEMFGLLPASRDAWGISVNKDNLLAQELAFLQKRGNVIDFSNVEALCWDAKAVGADKAEGTMRFRCKDAATAEQLAAAIRRANEDIELSVSENDMKLAISTSSRGKFAKVKFILEEFRDNLVESFFEED